MGTLNFKFSEHEVGQLIQKYREHPSGLISYSAFCRNIDTVFTDSVNPTDVIENSKSTANFTDADMQNLMKILGAIRT